MFANWDRNEGITYPRPPEVKQHYPQLCISIFREYTLHIYTLHNGTSIA